MIIKIANRFRPFSHVANSITLIPNSELAAEIYPSYIHIFNVATKDTLYEKHFSFGPLEKFTVILNLEKGRIEVTGRAASGFIRYFVDPTSIYFLKGGEEEKKVIFQEDKKIEPLLQRCRLSLGCHKAQNAEAIFARQDLTEILPIWFFLSQSLPKVADVKKPHFSPTLLTQVEEALKANDKGEGVYTALAAFFKAAFKGLFFPRLTDDYHQGFLLPIIQASHPFPLLILQKSYPLICQLFFQEREREREKMWRFLPCLPPQFHAGKLCDLVTSKGHKISLEWTKKTIFRLEIQAISDDHYAFKFHPDIKRFRLLNQGTSKTLGSVCSNGQEIMLRKNESYLLDRFER